MTSVSADGSAPSLLVCVNQQSAAAGMILQNGVFCVNVLRDDQAHISDTFAGRTKNPSGDRFEGVSWRTLKTGAPVLDEALVAFDCRLRQHLRHGTHHVLIGELVDIALNEPSSPLIYANRAYGRPAPLEALHRARDEPAGQSGTIAPDRMSGRAGAFRHGRAVGGLRRDATSDSRSSWSRRTRQR